MFARLRSVRLTKRLNSYLSVGVVHSPCQLGFAGQTARPTTDKLLQFAVTLCIYHIGGWRVANLIWIVRLVGFDIPQLPHVLRS
jgi:hypothetical protein